MFYFSQSVPCVMCFVLLLRIKKAEMKDDGRHARDLADQYAFLLFRDSSVMAKVIKQGLVARQMPFNALGKLFVFLGLHYGSNIAKKKNCFQATKS